MLGSTIYVLAAIAFVLISCLFLISVVRTCLDESIVIATPNISKKHGVFTSFGSVAVKGAPDDVFAAALEFIVHPDSSPLGEYMFEEAAPDGVPLVGSAGTFKLTVDDFPPMFIPIKLSMLDHKRRMICTTGTQYPKWLLSAEHIQEIILVDGEAGVCEYRTYYTMEGLASYYLLLFQKDELAETQRQCASDFKTFMESERSRLSHK